MDHRKTAVGKALTLPGWVLVLCALICLGAGTYYGVLLVNDRSSSQSPAPSKPTTAPAVTTPPPTEAPTPTPKATATPKPKAAPVLRNVPVGVFNNTGTGGLANSMSDKVRAAGWTVNGVGNWRGSVPATTIYYPAVFEEQARTLGRDLGVGRIVPRAESMRSDRLTLVLSGPQ